ncbi:MAG: hypothetical protein K6C97_04190 [Treponema sp.]|nr:hypothetical protein [Treponema sp.]
MKKSLSALLTASLLAVLFISCENPINTPQEETNPFTVIDLEIDEENDLSAYAGKKAFLVVTNNTTQTKQAFIPSNPSSTMYEVYENERASSPSVYNNQIINIPFEAPKIDINPIFDESIAAERSLNAPNATTYTLNDTKDFYGATSSNGTALYGEGSVLKVIGEHCYVWYKEKSGINVTDTQLKRLADTFDAIYEKETYLFGENYDPNCHYTNMITCDEEQKVHLIVYDLYDDYSVNQSGGVFGYFWSLDFFKNGTWGSFTTSGSNECECLHLDSHFLAIAEGSMLSTIAHEFQHLLNFVNKGLKYSTSNNTSIRYSSTWFDEMMSMTCEDIMQTQLDLEDRYSPKNRLSTFNLNYNLGFKTWREGDDVYASYANAYAFGAYLVRNFGIDFIKELAHNNYIDEEAITNALQAKAASIDTFDKALDNYYNVVLNPSGTYYTLNKSASQSYTIAGSSVTFECTAINISRYPTIDKQYVTEAYEDLYYNAEAGKNYYGPIILNSKVLNSLDPYGMFASYLGTIGSEGSYTLSSASVGSVKQVSYKLVITD